MLSLAVVSQVSSCATRLQMVYISYWDPSHCSLLNLHPRSLLDLLSFQGPHFKQAYI